MSDKLKALVSEPELFAVAVIKELNKLRDEIGTKATLAEIGTIQGERGEDGIDGRDGSDGKDGKDGINGIDGKNGRDGIDGSSGKDGLNGKDGVATNGKDAPEIDIEELMETLIEKIKKERRLDISHIRNSEQFMFGGTKYRISELMHGAGAGGGVTELTATGLVDGINTQFTFTQKPTYVIADGAWYKENIGWTWAGSTATLTVPPNDSIFGIS